MPTLEELLQAGATPVQEQEDPAVAQVREFTQAGAIPAAAPTPSSGGLTLEQLTQAGATPIPEQPKVSTGKAAARGAVAGGTLGTFAALNAAVDQAGSKILPDRALRFLQRIHPGEGLPIDQPATYEQRRAAYQGLLQQAQQQHPYAYGAGEFAGAAAVPIPGSGVGASVAKKLGGGALARVAGAGVTGGIAGELFGAGSAIGQGKSLTDIVTDAEKGSLYGAVSGAALHGVSELASKAATKASQALQEKYVQLFGGEVLGSASKKATQKSWAQVLGKEPEPGVTQTAEKYVQSKELAPVEAAARAGKYDQAIEEIDARLSKYSPGRAANYAKLEDGAKFEVGSGRDELDAALFKARNASKNPTAVKALENAKQQWEQDFASADTDMLKRALSSPSSVSPEAKQQLAEIAAKLPDNPRITRADYARAAQSVNASPETINYLTSLENVKMGPEKGAPNVFFKFDPKATIPAVELRQQATKLQQSALQSFDKLNPQFDEETKSTVKKAIVSALEKHLNKVAKAGPEYQAAVDRIRNDDVKFSVLLSAKQGLRESLEKQQRQELSLRTAARHLLHLGTIPAAAGAVGTGQETLNDVSEGKYGAALKHGAETAFLGGIAGRGLYRGAAIANNRLTPVLQSLQNNPAAQSLLSRVPQGVIGTTTLSTGTGQ